MSDNFKQTIKWKPNQFLIQPCNLLFSSLKISTRKMKKKKRTLLYFRFRLARRRLAAWNLSALGARANPTYRALRIFATRGRVGELRKPVFLAQGWISYQNNNNNRGNFKQSIFFKKSESIRFQIFDSDSDSWGSIPIPIRFRVLAQL